MQKLVEAPDRKRVDVCVNKEPSRRKKEIRSLFSSDQRSDNT